MRLSMTDFLKRLARHCTEAQDSCPSEAAKAYREIALMISGFQADYTEEWELNRKTEHDYIAAIELDARRAFPDPVALIEHIHKISSRPPVSDSAKISLCAIDAFCTDFLTKHRNQVYQENLKSAPF